MKPIQDPPRGTDPRDSRTQRGRTDLDRIEKLLAEAASYEPCMSLCVEQDGKAVELLLDTGISTYSEWIPGEGGDICLLRCRETKRVVGVRLPLINEKLAVFHKGQLRVNGGFKRAEISQP